MGIVDLNSIKGVIFDLDGTLLDSMPLWGHIEADYLISLGVTPRPGMSLDLRSLGGDEVPVYFKAEYGLSESVAEIGAGINGLAEFFYLHRVPLKDGVISVLDYLHERGMKMCIATATDRCLVEPALRRCGIDGYFGRIFTCNEVGVGKSSPEIYIRAAAYLETGISGALVVEDALYAMKSAKRAGFPIAAVYDRSADDQQDEIRALCDIYMKSLGELFTYF